MRTLGLHADEAPAAIRFTGDEDRLRPAITKVQAALTSTKITVTVPGARPYGSLLDPPGSDDYAIRYVWLRNAETDGLVTVREIAKGSGQAAVPSLMASVPKGLGINRVVPCTFCEAHGIVTGEAVDLVEL